MLEANKDIYDNIERVEIDKQKEFLPNNETTYLNTLTICLWTPLESVIFKSVSMYSLENKMWSSQKKAREWTGLERPNISCFHKINNHNAKDFIQQKDATNNRIKKEKLSRFVV